MVKKLRLRANKNYTSKISTVSDVSTENTVKIRQFAWEMNLKFQKAKIENLKFRLNHLRYFFCWVCYPSSARIAWGVNPIAAIWDVSSEFETAAPCFEQPSTKLKIKNTKGNIETMGFNWDASKKSGISKKWKFWRVRAQTNFFGKKIRNCRQGWDKKFPVKINTLLIKIQS